ncbi:MAG: GYD domain-containing protein [Gemmataceae bacterium]
MQRYIATIKFTQQGISNIKETCQRAEAFKSAAKSMGVEVVDIYWTLGPFDGLLVLDAPDEATVTAAMLQLGTQGNVETQTSRAFNASEMGSITSKLS